MVVLSQIQMGLITSIPSFSRSLKELVVIDLNYLWDIESG